MSNIPAVLARQVTERAGDRCEYCGLSQLGQEATFHIDHVVPRSADGPTAFENLALSCVSCSLRKGARQTALDPSTGTEANLFNPRSDRWNNHFRWGDLRVEGLSPTGRVTVEA